MKSNDKEGMTSNDQINADQNTTSASVSDQTLLKALQDFIVPLMRGAEGRRENDINQAPLGPEAEKLITALQEFISSIVRRSQSMTPNSFEVSLLEDKKAVPADLNDEEADDDDDDNDNDNDNDDDNDNDNDDNDDDHDDEAETSSFEGGPPPKTPLDPEVENRVMDNLLENNDTLDKPLPTFHDKLFNALRWHVFNAKPIRLLCFHPHGSSLQISLLERGAIHARFESVLRAEIHEADHIPIIEEETEDEAIERLISKYAQYAILSHTWLHTPSGEVTYSDWNKGLFDAKDPGYQKLVNFCKTSWMDHGLAFGWMDTVCINKESSTELDESIRSMYNWYRRAYVCITYLSETTVVSNMHTDQWFTRGWTLQELLAPDVIKFYNSDWKELLKHSHNDKTHVRITKQIERATTITEDELSDIYESPISRRMQLAANRVVTREEDMAYSLMGIFGISISTAYGEGADRAFFRLLQEILNSWSSRNVLDIFNWAGELPDSRPHVSVLLPSSLQHYLCRSSNENLLLDQPLEPLTLTHLGLHITVILMPAISISDESIQHDAIGDFKATVNISPALDYVDFPTTYNVLDKRISGPDGQNKDNDWYQITLVVFNFDGNETCLHSENLHRKGHGIRRTCW